MKIEVMDSDVRIEDGEIRIRLTADLEKLLNKKVELGTLSVGETFKIGDTEYIILEKTAQGVRCIAKKLLPGRKFDNNSNNWKTSSIREYLNSDYLKLLENEVGSSNVIAHEVDLTSNDGLDDYGTSTDKISLLTCDMYRKYVRILDKYKAGDWWWTLTPWSTDTHGYHRFVCYVGSDGALSYYDCVYVGVGVGVRPFCIFNSSIFVSR